MKVVLGLAFLLSLALAAPIPIGGFFYTTVAGTGAADTIGLSRKAAMVAAITAINSNVRYNATFTFNATYCDTQRDSNKAKTCATNARTAGAKAFIGGITSPETQAIISLATGIPFLTSGANAPEFSSATNYPRFLRSIPSGADQTRCLAKVITTKGTNLKVGEVYTSDDTATKAIGTALLTALQGRTPVTVSTTVVTGIPGANASNAANFLKSNGAQILPLIAQANDISILAQALNDLGFKAGSYIVAAPDSVLTSTSFAKPASQAVLQNAFACTLAPPSGANYTTFLANYAKAISQVAGAPTIPDSKAAHTYDLVYLLAEAYLKIFSGSLSQTDAAVLMTQLRAVNILGASGRINFAAGSNDIAEVRAYQVQRIVQRNFPVVGQFSAAGVLTFNDTTFVFPAPPGTPPPPAPQPQTPPATPQPAAKASVDYHAPFWKALKRAQRQH